MKDYYDVEPPKNTRKFYEPEKLQKWVNENAFKAFDKKLNTLESSGFKLRLTDMHYPEKTNFSLKEQKQAILEKRDLVIPLKGKFELIDKNDDRVVASKTAIVAQVPFITPRNTVILNGAEYIAINQQRLKPGIYTRIKESGEAEAHVNVQPGTGLSGKIIFHPDKALFVYELGTTQIKLYGLLKGLGVSDQQMESAWGKEIYLKNKLAFKGDELDKFHARINTFK